MEPECATPFLLAESHFQVIKYRRFWLAIQSSFPRIADTSATATDVP